MRKQGEGGLTLVELLVAMAIMGIVFVLVTNWQVSTLSISTRTNALSQRLSDLTDVTGYVGDRVRAAVRVRAASSNSLTVNTGTGSACSTERPCLAVVLPRPSATGEVTQYDLHIYRVEPRSVVNEADKVADTWAETNVQVLREYRTHSASSPATCQATPAQFAAGSFGGTSGNVSNCTTMHNLMNGATLAVSNTHPYLVSDHFTPANELGSSTVPFQYDATTKSVKLAFQTKQQVRGQTQLTPATPYTLTVQARNVP